MTDSRLRQDIIDELEFEPSIDAAGIGVTVEAGIVTLTGHVPSYLQKTTVEQVVRRVKGVRAIAIEIEVQPFGPDTTSDEQIAKRALDIIQWAGVLPRDAVQIKVENGWVTLTGKVD